jgi:formate dehydrogenase major subunit
MSYKYSKAKIPVELSVSEGCGNAPCDFKSQAISVPCQDGCPVQTNVPGYIENIAKGDYKAAYEINLEDNVLPGVLGRICARPCQKKCRHTWTDIQGTVEICHLKRSASDRVSGPVKAPPAYFKATSRKVAIIGGGPAGIAAARELRRYGHEVTIYEKEPYPGGMLIDGIPRFRLPIEIVEQEIKLVTDTGITVKTDHHIDNNALATIAQDFDAVLIATGTVRPNTIDLSNMDSGHFVTGLDFMKQYNCGSIKSLSGDIIIIGGGFTAVDSARSCARAARKLLGESGSVTIVYRRTEQYMAADLVELDEMANENIQIKTLLNPVSVKISDSKLSALTVRKNYLGNVSADGKPQIYEVESSDFDLPCNYLIQAIGQTQDWSILPEGVTLTEKFKTSDVKIFTAGDFLNGSNNVIRAIADGKVVASMIDTFLMGKERRSTYIKVEPAHSNGESGRSRQHDVQDSLPMPNLEVALRLPNDPEVELGFDDALTKTHATRCYFCHYKFEIDPDKCILCKWCIDVSPRNCIHNISHFDYDENGTIIKAHPADSIEKTAFVWIDSKNCIRCGKCLRVCPTSAISMKKTTIVNVNNNA